MSSPPHPLSSQNWNSLCLPQVTDSNSHTQEALQLELQLPKSTPLSNTHSSNDRHRCADMVLPSCLWILDHTTPWLSFLPFPLPSHVLRDSEVIERNSHLHFTAMQGSQARRRHDGSRGTCLVALGLERPSCPQRCLVSL